MAVLSGVDAGFKINELIIVSGSADGSFFEINRSTLICY